MLYITPEQQRAARIEVHPCQRQHHITPVSQRLHVACAVSNPQRFYSRYRLYEAFAKHMADSGVLLYTAELALRDRHHEIEGTTEHRLIRVRSDSELWHKENLLNIAVSHFDPDWVYGAYVDADFLFVRPDWATEAIHQLQHYSWVQLFHYYCDLSPDHVPSNPMPGFVRVVQDGGGRGTPPTDYESGEKGLWGAPGGAWAFRRAAFDACGGLLDTCILGSADWHMAVSLAGRKNPHTDLRVGSPGYVRSLDVWARRAAAIGRNIGHVDCFAVHGWHGRRARRGYSTRTEILKRYAFDPYTDLRTDSQGVLGWVGNKPDMEEAVRRYFKSRDEDSTTHP